MNLSRSFLRKSVILLALLLCFSSVLSAEEEQRAPRYRNRLGGGLSLSFTAMSEDISSNVFSISPKLEYAIFTRDGYFGVGGSLSIASLNFPSDDIEMKRVTFPLNVGAYIATGVYLTDNLRLEARLGGIMGDTDDAAIYFTGGLGVFYIFPYPFGISFMVNASYLGTQWGISPTVGFYWLYG